MKKWLPLIATFAMIITSPACSSNVDNVDERNIDDIDKHTVENIILRIEADELDSAISLIETMDEETLSTGKSEILNAVIQELNPYLNFNSWVSTAYSFVDERVIQDIEKYQTIVNMLSLNPDESNVDDFIAKALQLKQYTKQNTYHDAGGADDFKEIKSIMDQGAVYKSNPSIASKYYQQAYDKCMDAFNKFDGKTEYGMQEAADFYYNFAVQTKAIIDQSGTTSKQDDAYTSSTIAFKRIQSELIADLEDVISICDSFPKKLY